MKIDWITGPDAVALYQVPLHTMAAASNHGAVRRRTTGLKHHSFRYEYHRGDLEAWVNAWREANALPKPVKTTVRECLRCEKSFVSTGAGNRLCMVCRGYARSTNARTDDNFAYADSADLEV